MVGTNQDKLGTPNNNNKNITILKMLSLFLTTLALGVFCKKNIYFITNKNMIT
jgi:hypothetical protein